MRHKYLILLIIITLFPFFTDAEDIKDRSPEEYVKVLLGGIDSLSEKDKHKTYIEIAEIKCALGELSEASEYFEKASLSIKGEKDFSSLYRAAELNVETASYREAEAQIRAIMTFAENTGLRIMAGILSARIKSNNGLIDDAVLIINNIIKETAVLPRKGVSFIADFHEKYSEKYELPEMEEFLKRHMDTVPYKDVERLISPEMFFVSNDQAVQISESSEEQPALNADNDIEVFYIQLGSFSVKENAEDLFGRVAEKGYNAEIRKKTVNGKDYLVVAVPVAEAGGEQDLIIKLKEDGFEGYPVY